MDLLRHLRYFTTVAQTAHFGRAADSLGMTQPPLSQAIKRLEAELGYPLFERTTRGVRLSEAGRALLEPARAVLASADRFAAAADAAHAPSPAVAVGVCDSLPNDAIARIGSVPAVTMSGGSTRELLAGLSRGELASAIVDHPSPLPAMHGGPVIRVAAGAATTGAPTTLRGLHGSTLLVRPRSAAPAAHDLLIDSLNERAWSGPVAEVAGERELITRLLGGECWAVVPVCSHLPPPLRITAVTGIPPMRFRVVWRADAPVEVVAAAEHVSTSLSDWAADAVG